MKEETLYDKIHKEIGRFVSPEMSPKQAEILAKDVECVAVQAQIDLLGL